jgi:hypothetical protein
MESPLRPEAHTEPPSEEEIERARDIAIGQLLRRGLEVPDEAPAEQVATLLEAVEAFEEAVAKRGSDSFTNSLESSAPDDPDLVLPRPRADETIDGYAQRVRRLTEILG